jgi:hypothetical protein
MHLTAWKGRIIKVLISPWFLALFLSLIILVFIPKAKRYDLTLVERGVTNKVRSIVSYHDLDHDSRSEKVHLFENQIGNAAIKIEDWKGGLAGWYDYRGSFPKIPPLEGDYDHDGQRELYFLTHAGDSAFLNYLDPAPGKKHKAGSMFVAKLNTLMGKVDFEVNTMMMADLQADGTDEVCFSINAGHTLQPRRFYAWDRENDTLLKGPRMGCTFTFSPCNIDGDAAPEWLLNTSSLNNLPDTMHIALHDSCSWLAILDDDLTFLFDPVRFPTHKSSISTAVIRDGNQQFILALYDSYTEKHFPPCLYLYDLHGTLIRKRELSKPVNTDFYNLSYNYDEFGKFKFDRDGEHCYLADKSGNIYKVSAELHYVKTAAIDEKLITSYHGFDLDNDRHQELLFLCDDYESILVTREDFSHPVTGKLDFDRGHTAVSLQETGLGYPLLFLQRGEKEYWFRYAYNPLFYWQFLLWIGLYFVVLGIIHVIRKFQVIQQKQLKDTESRLAELQLSAVSSYLDPHFIFNALNTISSLIYKEDKEKAYDVFTRFSQLIRSTLIHSGTTATTLREEISFLSDFLEVQKVRYGNLFDYRIRVSEAVDTGVVVPKMLLQQFAENAIKHGLRERGREGLLEIGIDMKADGSITVSIRDNGVGRGKSAKAAHEEGSGKGIETMDSILALFEKLRKIRIERRINDLADAEGKALGTEVVLTIYAR